MSETQWIVDREGTRFPAADIDTLRQWATAGNVSATDQVWSPVRGEWARAQDIPEISELLVRSSLPVPSAGTSVVAGAGSGERASVSLRAVAYLLDVLPALPIALIAFIPLIGHIIAGCLLGLYWLYRDAKNYSLGKNTLGLKVVDLNGAQPTARALVRRQLPLGLAGFITAIPLLGIFAGPVAAFIAVAGNALLLMTEGYSIGDKLAGTTVVRK
ncbi:MAG: RDD family protein [Thermoanaerobaculia bacterium]